jgi:hypothetical protein
MKTPWTFSEGSQRAGFQDGVSGGSDNGRVYVSDRQRANLGVTDAYLTTVVARVLRRYRATASNVANLDRRR